MRIYFTEFALGYLLINYFIFFIKFTLFKILILICFFFINGNNLFYELIFY